MVKSVFFGLLVLFCAATAQVRAAGEDVKAAAVKKAKTAEEIKALRAAARPMLQLKKKHGAAMAALRREQAAEKKQAMARLPQGDAQKRSKVMSALLKKHRAAAQELRSENKAELDKFKTKNPESEKAYKELLYSGLRVEAPVAE